MKKCPYCNRAMTGALARRSEELDRLCKVQEALKRQIMETGMAARASKSRSMKRHSEDKIASMQKSLQRVERAFRNHRRLRRPPR